MLITRLFVVAVLCYQNVSCSYCDLDDTNCLTQGAKNTYLECVSGNLTGVPSSDPITLELIEVDQPELKFKIWNGTLTGMTTCTPELVKFNVIEMTYDYHVTCEHLITEGLYEVKGELNSMPVEGNGTFKNDHYDYVFLFNGEYETEINLDGKLYLIPKNFKLNTEVKGKVVYDCKNLYNGDTEKSAAMHKYANENWKEMDKIIGLPSMEKFMGVFIENVIAYMKVAPVEHVFALNVM